MTAFHAGRLYTATFRAGGSPPSLRHARLFIDHTVDLVLMDCGAWKTF